MEMTWLCHLAYAFMPAVTLLWGEALRARFLYRGARRAVRLLVAALLAWQSVRLLKYMLEPVPDAGDGLINAGISTTSSGRPCPSPCSGSRTWRTAMPSRAGCRRIFWRCCF